MGTLRNDGDRKYLLQRLARLNPDAKPLWGKMNAPQMLCHLRDSLAMALGEVAVKALKPNALQRFPLRQLVIYVLPMPKNIPTVPELQASQPGDFAADLREVAERVERMSKMPNGVGALHPLFGPMTNDEWCALQYKHAAHHLKQFGL